MIKNDQEEQEKRINYNDLVANAVTFQNEINFRENTLLC